MMTKNKVVDDAIGVLEWTTEVFSSAGKVANAMAELSDNVHNLARQTRKVQKGLHKAYEQGRTKK
jgi:hypothetical protein